MCGRYTIAKTKNEVLAYLNSNFNIKNIDGLSLPRYNISPSQSHLTIIRIEDSFKAGMINWNYKINYQGKLKQVINARSETVNKLYSFRDAFKTKRCLILADSFYEWDRETKQPYRFILEDSNIYLYAGIYDSYRENNKKKYGALILTTNANELVNEHHQRMPVILDLEAAKNYLNYSLSPEEITDLLKPYPAELMAKYPVSKEVNSPINDNASLIKKTTIN